MTQVRILRLVGVFLLCLHMTSSSFVLIASSSMTTTTNPAAEGTLDRVTPSRSKSETKSKSLTKTPSVSKTSAKSRSGSRSLSPSTSYSSSSSPSFSSSPSSSPSTTPSPTQSLSPTRTSTKSQSSTKSVSSSRSTTPSDSPSASRSMRAAKCKPACATILMPQDVGKPLTYSFGTCQYKFLNGSAETECRCKPGYAGPQCASVRYGGVFRRPDCSSNLCTAGGVCAYKSLLTSGDMSKQFCDCYPGWKGKRCQFAGDLRTPSIVSQGLLIVASLVPLVYSLKRLKFLQRKRHTARRLITRTHAVTGAMGMLSSFFFVLSWSYEDGYLDGYWVTGLWLRGAFQISAFVGVALLLFYWVAAGTHLEITVEDRLEQTKRTLRRFIALLFAMSVAWGTYATLKFANVLGEEAATFRLMVLLKGSTEMLVVVLLAATALRVRVRLGELGQTVGPVELQAREYDHSDSNTSWSLENLTTQLIYKSRIADWAQDTSSNALLEEDVDDEEWMHRQLRQMKDFLRIYLSLMVFVYLPITVTKMIGFGGGYWNEADNGMVAVLLDVTRTFVLIILVTLQQRVTK